jgi:putative glutamine amidotransferase
MRPVVGISSYREPASWGHWQRVPADLLPQRYADAVSRVGGVPVLLPPYTDASTAASALERLDALVIAGGADVDPARYGQPPGPRTTGWRADRDASELALLDTAADRALPTLGVCRGMQVMAVHARGSLLQHVPDITGHDGHSPGPDVYGPITVHTVDGTRLADLLGRSLTVPCHHHQAVDDPGELAAVGWCPDDRVIEIIEDPSRTFALGVQWHPERTADLRVFSALVEAASGRSQGNSSLAA